MSLTARADGKYEIVQRHGLIAIADTLCGPYLMQKPTWTYPSANRPSIDSIYPHRTSQPDPMITNPTYAWEEDPTIWYSGGRYHVLYQSSTDRIGYELSSPDGIHDWKDGGLAYDPRMYTKIFGYVGSTTYTQWYKMERPSVVLENGHVTHVTWAVADVDKDNQIPAGSNHGSKVIVVPFDGVSFDRDTGSSGGAGGSSGAGGAGGAGAGGAGGRGGAGGSAGSAGASGRGGGAGTGGTGTAGTGAGGTSTGGASGRGGGAGRVDGGTLDAAGGGTGGTSASDAGATAGRGGSTGAAGATSGAAGTGGTTGGGAGTGGPGGTGVAGTGQGGTGAGSAGSTGATGESTSGCSCAIHEGAPLSALPASLLLLGLVLVSRARPRRRGQ